MRTAWTRWLERCALPSRSSRTSSAFAALMLLVLVTTGHAGAAPAVAGVAAAAASCDQSGLPVPCAPAAVGCHAPVAVIPAVRRRGTARLQRLHRRGVLHRPRDPPLS